ncbi:Na+/H+ antiporter NhaA [Bosea sp. SSUT16]|jgi:NhaA family Na+:H+ antiporter|uniref:Na(+)/H(+) antiporter NhaA n=1 Tax=Bosea spartocytisi TaxID=2773451 RepID=A0A927ECW2_9HYPH|nr:Na+/H+ antiporter NhaA [Bosea spartocytisi]MBD3846991.1 Na+/H+ antiporter NhaA [Bosea spartocytisi]MCT4474220.1 Na+/H+ antiporter NhaA [Bosea spartocytisi]
MSQAAIANRLDRPVDDAADHVLGPGRAQITLVEYGSYACPHCRAANERIAEIRDQLGERVRYVFRHRPLTGSDIALRAAELVERARTAEQFWDAHVKLMTRSQVLTEDDLEAVARDLGLAEQTPDQAAQEAQQAAARVESDIESSHASGVRFTPTFFINERRYDGPWDESSFLDAMLGTLGHRFRTAALDFASWGPSAGILLLLATVLAIALTNSPLGPGFEAFWHREAALSFGDARFGMSLQHWVNDGLLTIFFLVVGLEIKREFTVGHLAGRRSAALPIAGAIGGMVVPALLYILVLPGGPWSHGWGVPMATDTAFAIAIIVMMGSRVPIELRIFLTAAAIVDDIGAIVVVALFYSGKLQLGYLIAALVLTGGLAALNRAHVYRVAPYALIGLALWACVHAGGLHATLAGVVLALFIPTRPPANLAALTAQANSIMLGEAAHGGEVLRHGPSTPALRALDAIHDRLESPADRLLRHAGARSSYLVLPLFALANAGVVIAPDVLEGRGMLVLAIAAGLVLGKPLGMLGAAALAVRLGVALKPAEYSWLQLAGASALAGIGFTMSLFIAGQAFADPGDFAAAKIAVFAASIASALLGAGLLAAAARRFADRAA